MRSQAKKISSLSFSERLLRAKKIHGFTNEDLGDILGISGPAVSQLIHEQTKPRPRTQILLERLEVKGTEDVEGQSAENLLDDCIERIHLIYKLGRTQTLKALLPLLDLVSTPRPEDHEPQD